jgi:hypothetical protein
MHFIHTLLNSDVIHNKVSRAVNQTAVMNHAGRTGWHSLVASCRLSGQLALFPRRHRRLCATPSHASAAQGVLCADCAERPPLSGARRCARRYAGAASARAIYRGHTLCPTRDSRALCPATEPVCVWEGMSRPVCVRSEGTPTSSFTCSVNIFTVINRGRGVASRTVGRHCDCCRRQLSSHHP